MRSGVEISAIVVENFIVTEWLSSLKNTVSNVIKFLRRDCLPPDDDSFVFIWLDGCKRG